MKNLNYFWIGGGLGILDQLCGRLTLTALGQDPWCAHQVLADLAIWAMFILLILRREKPSPKEMFRDLTLFFLGLCIFYYAYEAIVVNHDMCLAIHNHSRFADPLQDAVLQNIGFTALDALAWFVVGFAAAVWGFFTTKLRLAEKKAGYWAMTAPLFLSILFMIGVNAFCLISDHVNLLPLIFDTGALCLCAYLYFIRSPFPKKDA